jgi:hypothetical protein
LPRDPSRPLLADVARTPAQLHGVKEGRKIERPSRRDSFTVRWRFPPALRLLPRRRRRVQQSIDLFQLDGTAEPFFI